MKRLAAFTSWMYRQGLSLYPAEFLAVFGAEMQSVFDQALAVRARDSLVSLLAFCLIEMRDLPASLLRQHWQRLWNKGGKMTALTESARPISEMDQADHQPGSRGSAIFAGLPHLLIGLLIAHGKLFGDTPSYRLVGTVIGIVLMLLVVGVLAFAWRNRWPLWSASWYLYGSWAGLVLISLVFLRLDPQENWVDTSRLPLTWFGICIIGYFVLLIRDRLKGLLAIAFLFPFVGLSLLEFIPNPIEAVLAIGLGALTGLAAARIVRQGRFQSALRLLLGVNAFAALLLAYISVYQAKDLPEGFSYHIPEFPEFLSLLGLYLLIALGIISLPFLVRRLWRFGKRTLSS